MSVGIGLGFTQKNRFKYIENPTITNSNICNLFNRINSTNF
jgi:hypothetical protein